MSDYISREDVLKGQKTGTFANGICFEAKRCVPVEYIESLEPADVVPVVRCKDCLFFTTEKSCCRPEGLIKAREDAFCSYGERKE